MINDRNNLIHFIMQTSFEIFGAKYTQVNEVEVSFNMEYVLTHRAIK